MKYTLFVLGLLASTLTIAQDTTGFCDPAEGGIEERWYDTKIGSQKALIFSPESTANSNLVVFIHGDSPFGDPTYQYHISKRLSEITNSVTAAILRPGYKDGCGDTSEGIRGLTMGDNYTQEVVDALATVISAIQGEEKTKQTIVMGHSGGAALTALLAESNPELANQSILVACPCNLSAWRKSMEALTESSNWSRPMGGLSPIDGISELALDKNIRLYVGENDPVAPPSLTSEFFNAAQRLGANVTMNIIPGEGHESILKPEYLLLMMKDAGLLPD